jgi:hypothetical protein
VNSDSVLLISKEDSAIENYRIIKNISYLGFKKVKQHFMDKDIYSKKNIEVQVTHYSKWEKKIYLLSIYKLFKKST